VQNPRAARHVTPAAEVQQGAWKVETASSAILQVVTLQSPKGIYDGLFLFELRHHQHP